VAPLAPRDRQILARQTTFGSISTTVVLEHTCHLPWCFWPSASSPRGAAGYTCTACGPAPAPRRCWGRYSRGIGVGPSPFAACTPVPKSVHTTFIHSHKRNPRRHPLSPPFAKGGRGGFFAGRRCHTMYQPHVD
jgi:hypothetical protein